MGEAGNAEEKRNTETETRQYSSHYSSSSGERHHSSSHHSSSGSSHRGHHPHHSCSKRRHSSSSNNIPAEYEKKKRTRLYWRIFFIAAVIGVMIWLVIKIVNVDNKDDWDVPLWLQPKQSTEQLQSELDELRTENMMLKYELDKYKEKYGELESESDAADTGKTK